MHSLTLNVNDSFYNQLLSFLNQNQNQVNIVEDIADSYPSISKNEANQRVTKAAEEYRNGTMKTVPYSQGMDEIDNWLNTL
jgi:predicted patatin/cPLA2 family phospholipase